MIAFLFYLLTVLWLLGCLGVLIAIIAGGVLVFRSLLKTPDSPSAHRPKNHNYRSEAMTVQELEDSLLLVHDTLCMDREEGGAYTACDRPNPILAAVHLDRVRQRIKAEGITDARRGPESERLRDNG